MDKTAQRSCLISLVQSFYRLRRDEHSEMKMGEGHEQAIRK